MTTERSTDSPGRPPRPGEGLSAVLPATGATPLAARAAAAGSPSPVFIDEARQLERACSRWREAEALAVDTEFVRERTFYPGLGLIQISDGEETSLVDPVAVADLGPLQEVFAAPRVTKVLHSCSEDMEVFYHRFGALPWPVFDTQIAAAFVGLGYALGYAALVDALFGVDVPKQHTRTNWLRRPLSEAQKSYAALDVAYLLPIYDVLSEGLRRTGRESWARDEFEPLRDAGRFLPDPETVYRKIKRRGSLDRRQLGVLRALAAWRETEARRRDLPRNFVLREATLPELARRQPRSLRDLDRNRVLQPEEIRRHGRALLGLIERSSALPEEELPEKPERPIDLAPYRRQLDRMRRTVAEAAAELGIPAELLATRRTVERLARRVLTGREPPLPQELRGWRRDVIGERLLALFAPNESQKNFS